MTGGSLGRILILRRLGLLAAFGLLVGAGAALRSDFACNKGKVIALCDGDSCVVCYGMNCQDTNQATAERMCGGQ